MKKLLLAVNVFLFGIILFMACTSPDKKTTGNAQKPDPKSGCLEFCDNYADSNLAGIINGELLHKLSEDYRSDKTKSKINYNSATDVSLGDDALSLTFDLNKMKNFIWHMENAICKAGCDPKPELGIRFYYIKYPKGLDTTAVPEDLAGIMAANANKHALAMVPVRKIGNDWYDFDFTQVYEGCKFEKLALSPSKWSAAVISLGDGDNHGGLGPPPGRGTYPTIPD